MGEQAPVKCVDAKQENCAIPMENKAKKQAGILTFSYSSNPGSVLQAYALQQTISEMDAMECSIINYQKTAADKPIVGRNVFCGPVKTWTPGKIISWVKRLIVYPLRMEKYECFFREYYHNFRELPYSREELQETNRAYDVFVVGSDQVWNLDSISVDETYFLDFVTDAKKKVSYAASFGQKGVPERGAESASQLIKDFSAISVREQQGVQTVRELTGREAEWVLDPSLLRSKQEYASMAVLPKEKDFVFVYVREIARILMTLQSGWHFGKACRLLR